MKQKIGIIGGSGLYDIEGISNVRKERVQTPFGDPSDAYCVGELEGVKVVFLPRHGEGHVLLPSEINYRANIYGFKKMGIDRIISVSAVGSLKEHIHPLDMVVPDQFFDRTNATRKATFFGDGVVAHVGFGNPVCPQVASALVNAAKSLHIPVHEGGTYVNMEGPAFSTKAESNVYRSWGMDIIGMTNLIEAKLAREAEICYATLAMVTDYDCWHESHEHVTVETIIGYLTKNVVNAKQIIKSIVSALPDTRECTCHKALESAILTNPEKIPHDTYKKLELLLGKYIKK